MNIASRSNFEKKNAKTYNKNIKIFKKYDMGLYELARTLENSESVKAIKFDANNINTAAGKPFYEFSIEVNSNLESEFPVYNKKWALEFVNGQKFEKTDEQKYPVTGKLLNSIIEFAENDHSYMPRAIYEPRTPPFAFLAGLRAGLVLEKWAFKNNIHSMYVYEPEPRFFYLSLYYTDYEKVFAKFKNNLKLQIGGKLDTKRLAHMIEERKITNSFSYIYSIAYSHPAFRDVSSALKAVFTAGLRNWGTYEDEMKGVKNHLQNINKYPTLTKSKNLNIPVCIVANGKSLEKNIEFIKKNQNSMIIISVGTAIKPLLNAGIESDFHIEQERIDLLKDVLKDILPNYNGYFVGANVVNPLIFKMAKKPLMYIREGFTLSTNPLIGSSPIVGNSGVAFAKTFSNEIYLCGMDLGFRLGEKKHSKNSFYDDSAEDVATDGIKVEANFGGEIHSDSLLLQSKDSIEKLIAKYNLKVYNLSDGVKIAGVEPTEGDIELPEINKQQYIEEILKLFTETDFNAENPKLDVLIDIFIRIFDKSINSYYDLDNLVDDTRNILYDFAFKNDMKSELAMMRGTLQHILLFFYAYAHRIHFNKIKDLQQLVIHQLERINW